VNAIYLDADVPTGQEAFVALNAKLAPKWPQITKKKAALPEAPEFRGAKGKLKLVSEKPGR
jgi:ferredoxin